MKPLPYYRKHSVCIRKNIIVPKTNHRIPFPFKPIIPLLVFLLFLRKGMVASIQLNDEFPLKTNKVNDIPSNWTLPPEFHAFESAGPKTAPQELLGIG